MAEITLDEYLKTHTQQEAAEIIGCTDGAVWQMLRARRDIRLRLDDTGRPVSAYEIKLLGSRVSNGSNSAESTEAA